MSTSSIVLFALTAMIASIPVIGSAQAADSGKGADQIVQPVAKDIDASKLWDGRKIAPFKVIDNPPMVNAADAEFMIPSDYVLGITVNGESRAYPTRFVWFHHAINDTFSGASGDKHVAITYCSVCNTGVRYDPVLNGKLVLFDFFGLYNGIVALCDRETHGVILQGEGRIINGPLVDSHFRTEPILDTTWSQWRRLHPDTKVMSPDTDYKRFYSPQNHPEPRGYDKFPAPYFKPTVTRGDLRMPPFDKVLGVTLPAAAGDTFQHRAYPIKTLITCGVVNEAIGSTEIAVFFDPQSAAATAVSARVGGKTLTFELRASDGVIGFYDRQTGSKWNIEGKAEEGKLKGKQLDRLDCHLSQWYGWCACFPETTIYGSNETPKPGNPFTLPTDGSGVAQ